MSDQYIKEIDEAISFYQIPDLLYFGFNQQILNAQCEVINSMKYYPKDNYCFSNKEDVFQHLFPKYIGYSVSNISDWGNMKKTLNMLEWGACWRVAYRRELLIKYNIRFNSEIKMNEDSMFNALATLYATKTASIDKGLYNYYLRTTGALNSQLSSKVIQNKEALFKERERITNLAQTNGFNVDESCYAGSVVMGIIEMFAKSSFDDWVKLREIIANKTTQKCIELIPLTKKVKFCVCAALLKMHLSFILFLLIQFAKKIGIEFKP